MACRVLGALLFASLCCLPAISQKTASTPEVKATTPSSSPEEAGFPVKDQLTLTKCGGCHAPDAKGNMTRISYIRTTPEGWEEAMKRMIRLNGLQLSPEEARGILRYLSDYHGLAPEENARIAYFTEHRIIDEKIPSPEVAHACAACHALAKPLSWHRTSSDWQYLENMHVAFFPSVRFTAFDHPRERGDAVPPKGPTPAEQALDYIVKSSPLHTTEWAEWQASMQAPKLAGRWLISGQEPGKGRFFGEMTIEPSASGDFTTRTKITCNEASSVMATSGKALVYTGYSWRGRSTVEPGGTTTPETPQTVREVMALSKDQSQLTGRWFWGNYSEFGMDVTMRRATSAPMLIGVDKPSLKAGASDATDEHLWRCPAHEPKRERRGSWARGQGNQDHRPTARLRDRERQRKPGGSPRKSHGFSKDCEPSRCLRCLRSHRLPEGNAGHVDRPPGWCAPSQRVRPVRNRCF